MDTGPPRSEGHDTELSLLDATFEAVSLAKESSSVVPAKTAFDSVSALLDKIKGCKANERQDYVELGLSCADACKVLDRGLNGKQSDDLSQSVLSAIEQLSTTATAIQKRIDKQGKWSAVSRHFRKKSGNDKIAAWKQVLVAVHRTFDTELAPIAQIETTDTHCNASTSQEDAQLHENSPSQPPAQGSKPGNSNLDRAVEAVQRAIDQDVNQNYAEALGEYKRALDWFLLALKYEQNAGSKSTWKEENQKGTRRGPSERPLPRHTPTTNWAMLLNLHSGLSTKMSGKTIGRHSDYTGMLWTRQCWL